MLASLRVLIVENGLLEASATRAMIEMLGGEVSLVVSSVAAGLDAVREESFDVALLNVAVQGASSRPIAAVLSNAALPFLLTADDDDAALHGFDDVPILIKPLRLSRLGPALIAAAAPTQAAGTSSSTSRIDSQRG